MILAPTLTLSAGSGAAIVRPSFSRDFAGEKTLDNGTGPAITFTRASDATFFDANGTLQTASNDAPRFDHDPATAANPSRGLLIEEARTNLLVRSEEFSTTWVTSNSAITANSVAAPTGSTTADTLVENNAANFHYVEQLVSTTTNSNNYVFSCFVKAGTRSAARITILEGATLSRQVRATADLASGTVVGLGLNSGSLTAATIQNVGSGWFRISVAGILGGSDTSIRCLVFIGQDTSTFNYTGDGTSDIFIWGAQLEAGAFPTSYIPTTTAAATRAADSAVVTPVSSFYNQSEGTLFAEAMRTQAVAAGAFPVMVWLQANDPTVRMVLLATSGRAYFAANSVATTEWEIGASLAKYDITLGTAFKIAGGYAADNVAVSMNGQSVDTDTAAQVLSGLTIFRIGRSNGATNFWNGHIRKIAYWPKRLTNTLLEQLTT